MKRPPQRFEQMVRGHLRENAAGLALAGACIAGYSAAELLAPWPLKLILDHLLLEKPLPETLRFLAPLIAERPETAIILIASAILGIAALKGLFSYTQVYVTSRIGYQIVHKVRRELFAHLQRLSLSFHSRSRAGELLTKVTSDTNVLKDAFSGSLLELAGHTLTLTGMCVILFALNARLAAVVVLTLPLLAALIFTIYKRGKTSARRQRESEGVVAARIGEILHLTPLVRAFARERVEEDRFEQESARTLENSIRTARVEAAAGRAVEITHAAGVWAAVLFGSLLAWRGEMTPGDLLVFSAYLTSLYKPLRNLAKLSTQFSKAMVSAERIEQILAAEPDIPALRGGVVAQGLAGEINFFEVTFGYDPARPVLRGINLRIRAGERVALVGASGAGKSTIAGLLLRFHKPDSGRIRVDGVDIQDYDSESYRRQIGVVLQDTLLFGATIRENIAYGKPDATSQEIEAAARQAAAHEFIACLADGYATVIGERGSTLSGGQRQRICLARAILMKPSLMILDEPTSAVDAESSRLIHQAIEQAQRGKTTIVIAHQFHAMRTFDRILVLDRGSIVEQGSHDELLKRQGLYWELHQSEEVSI
ncbi:MAG: ABC transporter ATP-binding protein [Bryobacteraceae bacterium]|nr:ABC transporter ATP-binding protein [Bryobacteraceae bacterium]